MFLIKLYVSLKSEGMNLFLTKMEFIPETTDEEDLVARRLSQRLSVASSTTLPNMNEKRESPNEADENTQHELERCERIRTKYPEVSCLHLLDYNNLSKQNKNLKWLFVFSC